MSDEIIINPDIEYTVEISEKLTPDYKISSQIQEWLKTNLEGLTDDNNNIIFNKVNNGYNDSTLNTFANKPVCDIHITEVEYDTDLDDHKPVSINTALIFYLKGANNHTNMLACDIHDYIMQEFLTNTVFQCLENIVKETYITGSRIMNQPLNKKWGVMGTFELTHILY